MLEETSDSIFFFLHNDIDCRTNNTFNLWDKVGKCTLWKRKHEFSENTNQFFRVTTVNLTYVALVKNMPFTAIGSGSNNLHRGRYQSSIILFVLRHAQNPNGPGLGSGLGTTERAVILFRDVGHCGTSSSHSGNSIIIQYKRTNRH
jgi:hypothetical protein